MRILIDQENLSWDEAWDITVRTLGYTNHTLMPEALEKWSIPMLESILPRHMQIIYEINHRFIQKAATFFPMQSDRIAKVSIIEESNPKMVRMANLAIVGTHSTNGVAQLHSDLLRTSMFPEFNTIFPDRFNNKTNGITQRRWLLDANPGLAAKISGSRTSPRYPDCAPSPTTRRSARISRRSSMMRRYARRNSSGRTAGSSSIRTRSWMSRSRGSTNTRDS